MKEAIFFEPMTESSARMIANWTYSGPYSLYSMDGSDESIRELCEEQYYCAYNQSRDVIGFICAGKAARVAGGYDAGIYDEDKYVDIGLGMKPELTGKGKGERFVLAAIQYLQRSQACGRFRLVVLQFNQRAMKVYEKVGFYKDTGFESKIHGVPHKFICMKRE